MKTLPTAVLISALLMSAVVGIHFVSLAGAYPIGPPSPDMPLITIGSDGSIFPSSTLIIRAGSDYTLTGDIINYSLEVRCNNITLDGAGFTIRETPSSGYAPSCGLTIYSNGVTVKNLNIEFRDAAIEVNGSHNVVRNNTLCSSANIAGNYNEILENVFPRSYLTVEGDYNTIKGNLLSGRSIIAGGNFNKFIANTIEQCIYFAVLPSEGTNFFHLNNFINNTLFYNYPDDSTTEIPGLNLAMLPQDNVSPLRWESIPYGWKAIYPANTVFDNGALGNYWSDYTGADANHDGVGDTPYIIGGTLQDNYPLMVPFNISNVPFEPPESLSISPSTSPSTQDNSQSPEPQNNQSFPTVFVTTASAASAFIFGVVLLVYFKKRIAIRDKHE